MEIKYLKVYHQIKDKILRQTWKIGDSLGTEQELAEMYGVSRVTIRKALNLLKEEGVVESRRGSGNRVLSIQYQQETIVKKEGPVQEFLVPKPWKVMNSIAAVDIVGASTELAEWFGIATGTDIYRVQHMRYVNERPYGYISTYYPISLTPGLENKQVTAPVSLYVKRVYGLNFDRREDLYTAEVAKFKEMQYLGVALGDPLLFNVRLRFYRGQLVEVSEYKINARMARLKYEDPSDSMLEEEESELLGDISFESAQMSGRIDVEGR